MIQKYEFGLVGLGVMGRNFILNVAEHGFSAMGFDLDEEKVKALRNERGSLPVEGTTAVQNFVESLSQPRKIMLLVPAGKPVDQVIDSIKPYLSKGDLIIDGGNSHYDDTNRRNQSLFNEGFHFLGTGVSGGSKGARFGPSIMPGGRKEAYEIIRPIFESTSAKVNDEPCVDWMGNSSAGNYVKMVHNGIEYGLMQLISESYHLLKSGLGLSNSAIGATYKNWNERDLSSYLIEITSHIFHKKDEFSDQYMVDLILDKAGQKGTGKWTSQNAMDLGVAIPSIDSAVTMRVMSSLKEIRVSTSEKYNFNKIKNPENLEIEDIEKALFFSYVITYAQGLSQLIIASENYKYELSIERIAKIWRGGCIIRASLLEDIRKVYKRKPYLYSLLEDVYFVDLLKENLDSMRKTAAFAVTQGIPLMGMLAALSYFDSFTCSRLPTNLIQAQRDYFGSHTYERTDRVGVFHTADWQ